MVVHSKLAFRECRKCGRWFTAEAKSAKHRFFCLPCGESEVRKQRHARRDQKRLTRYEPYTLAEIAQRDSYRCGFCGKRVLMDRKVPHHKAPTIDHIIPLSAGGHDTKANVQLAHFLCNSSAVAGGVKQLLLVG